MKTASIYKTPAGERAVMELYDNLIAQWSVPYEELTVPTQYGDTFVIASGDKSAPPMILLHGAGSNSAIWAADVGEYSRHYRTYAIDLLGEPGKSAPNRPAWDSPAYAEWLAEVMGRLQIASATLVGISQGGWTALKLATSQPERANRLVLLCPGGVVPDRASFLLRAIPLMMLGKWGIRRMITMLFGCQPIPDGVEDVMLLVTHNFKTRIGVLPVFTDKELQRLTMPTLLIGGTQDVMRDNEKIAARLKQFLPQFDAIIVPGAGHALINTTDDIMSFLGSPQPA
jgi:pimeloyl-ACP methyl ester carboxylesterase